MLHSRRRRWCMRRRGGHPSLDELTHTLRTTPRSKREHSTHTADSSHAIVCARNSAARHLLLAPRREPRLPSMACALIGFNQATMRMAAAHRCPPTERTTTLRGPPPRHRPPPRATARARSTAEPHDAAERQHPGEEDGRLEQEPRHVLLTPEFLPSAADLRAVFDERCGRIASV